MLPPPTPLCGHGVQRITTLCSTQLNIDKCQCGRISPLQVVQACCKGDKGLRDHQGGGARRLGCTVERVERERGQNPPTRTNSAVSPGSVLLLVGTWSVSAVAAFFLKIFFRQQQQIPAGMPSSRSRASRGFPPVLSRRSAEDNASV